MPIVTVGKEISLSDKLSLNLGCGGYSNHNETRKGFALFFEEDDTHVWEIQTKLELDYKFSDHIKTTVSYRYSWLTDQG